MVAITSHGSSPATGNAQTEISSESDAAFIDGHSGNPEALDKRFGDQAQAACSSRSDDYLRGIAAHDFAWDADAKGMFGIKFDKISLASAGSGLLTLLSTRAKLSNGFGAFEHVKIYCLYNTSSREVVRLAQNDPAAVTVIAADHDAHTSSTSTPTAKPTELVIHRATSDSNTLPVVQSETGELDAVDTTLGNQP